MQKNVDMLSKLENVTDKTKLTGDEIIAVSKYVMEQRTEMAREMVALKEQKRLNDIQMNFVKRKMGELGHGSRPTMVINLDPQLQTVLSELARRQGAALFELRATLDDFELRGQPARAALVAAVSRMPTNGAMPEVALARTALDQADATRS